MDTNNKKLKATDWFKIFTRKQLLRPTMYSSKHHNKETLKNSQEPIHLSK